MVLIERFLRFPDGEDQVQEFAHGVADGDGFAVDGCMTRFARDEPRISRIARMEKREAVFSYPRNPCNPWFFLSWRTDHVVQPRSMPTPIFVCVWDDGSW